MPATVREDLWNTPSSRHEAACTSGSVATLAAIADLRSGAYQTALVVGVELEKTVPGDTAAEHLGAAAWIGYESADAKFMWPNLFASYNPTFGQGMTMTSLQAGHLRQTLQTPGADLAGQFNRATAKSTYPVWTMNAIGDLVLHRASGPMPWWYRPVGGLFDQFLGAAETDPVLAEWFLRRFSLLDSLWMVPSTRLVGRTIRHNMRLWLAEKRAAKRPAAVSARR
jgi:hypothetical protein